MEQPMRRKRGFTLVELLVVIGIIALLIAILLPTLKKARESANRIKCQSNIHQIVLSMFMYSNDQKSKMYLYSSWPGGNDSLYPLHPWPAPKDTISGPIYLSNFHAAICPSTNHHVENPDHLRDNAKGVDDAQGTLGLGGAHSYELTTFMWPNETFPDGYKTGIPKPGETYCWKTQGNSSKNASQNMINRDAVDSPPSADNNWPTPPTNHGSQGYCACPRWPFRFCSCGKALGRGLYGWTLPLRALSKVALNSNGLTAPHLDCGSKNSRF
jgi:prepilin-type N-terminal cleavage/methylation domain-containing protein